MSTPHPLPDYLRELADQLEWMGLDRREVISIQLLEPYASNGHGVVLYVEEPALRRVESDGGPEAVPYTDVYVLLKRGDINLRALVSR